MKLSVVTRPAHLMFLYGIVPSMLHRARSCCLSACLPVCLPAPSYLLSIHPPIGPLLVPVCFVITHASCLPLPILICVLFRARLADERKRAKGALPTCPPGHAGAPCGVTPPITVCSFLCGDASPDVLLQHPT